MHQLIEKYGKQTISELLDLVFIVKNPTPKQWKEFLIRSEILPKKSKANIVGYIFQSLIDKEWQVNPETKMWETVLIEPYTEYRIYCKNGRGIYLFREGFNSKELDQIKKELYENETNQNHE